jgi:Fic family protein
MSKSASYKILDDIKFFIPSSLLPKDQEFQMDTEMIALYGDTMLQLGKLNEMTNRLINVEHFIRAYVYKEALLSSSIEGINTTLLNVFTQSILEIKGDKSTQLVMNYTKAIYKALSMIKEDNLPIIERVILRAHEELMTGGSGDISDPGNYRKQTVKVGDLIPPPANKVPKLMSQLERFINIDDKFSSIIRAGLVHVQFETIHPFLDDNGRIGRLLIVLMLVESGILSEPIIYPSYYFKKHHFDYYKLLDGVRVNGDFESWIKYYLSVIRDSAIDACRRAQDIEELSDVMNKAISEKFVRGLKKRIEVIPILFNYPVISIKKLSDELKVSYNTASKIVLDFLSMGFLIEEDQKKRDRLFRFKIYFEILERVYD